MPNEKFMKEALIEAKLALLAGEVPVGAVIVKGDEIIARAHNTREASHDPTAHAEILVIRQAAAKLDDWRLTNCELYVTLEPCPMCAGAILQSRIANVWYGSYDRQGGCCGSIYRITEDPAFNHFAKAVGGILKDDCDAVFEEFLRGVRGKSS